MSNICIGRPIIEILAKEGAWCNSDGDCVIAADELRGNNPYAELDRLRAPDITPKMIEAAAKAIGSTRSGLAQLTDCDDNDRCNQSCEIDGGTCICIELHYEQAKAALSAARAVLAKTAPPGKEDNDLTQE